VDVLIINVHSLRNAGDAALAEMAVRTVRSAFDHPHILVAATDWTEMEVAPEWEPIDMIGSFAARFRSHQRGKDRWRLWAIVTGVFVSLTYVLERRVARRPCHSFGRWQALLDAYANADVVVSCPGNILSNTATWGLPFLVATWTIAFAQMLGKPLYVLPQSVGPFRHRWEHAILKRLYGQARIVMLREPVSFRLARESGIAETRLRLVPDLAFAYPAAELGADDPLMSRLHRCARPLVGVTVTNSLVSRLGDAVWNQYEIAIAEALSSFQDALGGCIVFFPQVTGPTEKEDDRIAARRIASRMDQGTDVLLIESALSPGILKALYGTTDVFVATRMHSAIFAMSMYVPTIVIAYMHKSHGLAELLGTEDLTLSVEDVDGTSLSRLLFQLWDDRPAVQLCLHDRIPEIVRKAADAFRLLAE